MLTQDAFKGDVSHSASEWVIDSSLFDFTDVTLVSEDTYYTAAKATWISKRVEGTWTGPKSYNHVEFDRAENLLQTAILSHQFAVFVWLAFTRLTAVTRLMWLWWVRILMTVMTLTLGLFTHGLCLCLYPSLSPYFPIIIIINTFKKSCSIQSVSQAVS